MNNIISTKAFYYYISSKAACDPCKTIYLCTPGSASTSIQAAEQFAVKSGWQAMAEEQEAILVVPVALNGWNAEPISLLLDIYNETKNSFHTRSGEAIWGRAGSLWCWETILYLVGYEDGATFAGNVLVGNPNMFAGVALVNGVPNDYSKAKEPSSHWMVKTVSEDYAVKNSEIPVHLWLFEDNKEIAQKAVDYFGRSCSKENPAEQVRLFVDEYSSEDTVLNRMIFEECFNHVIRWKNSPDGTLALVDSKREFYANPRFIRHTAVVGEHIYDYFVHLALELMLRANHCEEHPFEVYTKDNYFTLEKGYKDGERFHTEVYCQKDQSARVCITVMKYMPHGAIAEEARFTWEFLKHFRRCSRQKEHYRKYNEKNAEVR